MTKTATADAHKTDATPVTPLFEGAKVVVDETSKAVTPFGGLCSFIVYLQQIGFGARIEQRIEELKNDLAAGGFCVREFFGTESAFLGVLFAFNLLSLYQRQVTPEKPYRQAATLRSQVFVATRP